MLFQKFTDLESAEMILDEFKKNGIECHIEDNNHAYVSVVGFNSIDFAVALNIKQCDFVKAEEVLGLFYERHIAAIDPEYYLFNFTTEELREILYNPLEWGLLDYHLAKQILINRGVPVDEGQLKLVKAEKIADLGKAKPISPFRLFVYYLFCFVFPPYSMVNGFLIVNGGSTLPNGQKVYSRPEKDRRHGKIMIGLSIVATIVIISLSSRNSS